MKSDRIDTMWMFVTVDDSGSEGVICVPTNIGFIPLVTANASQLETLRNTVKNVANSTKQRIKLIKLTTREDVDEINPDLPLALF